MITNSLYFIFFIFSVNMWMKLSIFAAMKRAIIIGASSGIGREVAMLLLADGWRVGIAARRIEVLREIKNAFPEQVETVRIDITDNGAATELQSLVDRLGGMDLYFHASGIGQQNRTVDADIEMRIVETNALGFTRMVDAAFGYMVAHGGGHIAVISSIAGTKGLGPVAAYSATKAFQNTYIQALEQLSISRKLNLSFTDIRPGFVDTPLLTGDRYPLLMDKTRVARYIVRALAARRHVCIIDWRYRILVFFWRLIPNRMWRKMRLTNQKG